MRGENVKQKVIYVNNYISSFNPGIFEVYASKLSVMKNKEIMREYQSL